MKDNIKRLLESYKDLILSANRLDVQNGGQKVELEKIFSIVDLVFENQSFYGLKTKEIDLKNGFIIQKRQQCIGSIGVIEENNNIYNIFYATMMGIFTKNKIFVNLETNINYGTIKTIIELLKKISVQAEITKFENCLFVEKISMLDKLFIIGARSFYNLFDKKYVSCVFVPYGEITVLRHTDIFDEIISKIVNCIVYEKDEFTNMSEACKTLSASTTPYMTVLFTENTKDAEIFLNNCKSDFAFVNVNPKINDLINLRQIDFLKENVLCYSKQ